MTRPENELSRGVNREIPKKIPTNEDLFSSKNREIDREQTIFQSETPPQEILSTPESREQSEQVEIQPSQERRIFFKQPQKEFLRLWRKMGEMWREGKITGEERKKCLTAFALWVIHGGVSFAGTSKVGFSFGLHLLRTRSITSLLYKIQSNPSFIATYGFIIPAAVKLGSVLVSEWLFGVKFSMLSKLLSILLGTAMPIEIARTLGEKSWLANKIRGRLEPPLTWAGSVAQKVRNVFKG